MGVGSSPVLQGGRLILQCDEDAGEHSVITALEASMGKELWRTPRKVEASWATPVLIDTGGTEQIVASGNEIIAAYDPATGNKLWQIKGLASNAIHTPLFGNGLVYLSAGFPRKVTVAIEPGREAPPRVAWKHERGTGYVVSPILYEGRVYLVSDQGIVSCLDARTGDVTYDSPSGCRRVSRPRR